MQNAIQNSYTQPIREIRVISGCGKMFNQINPFMQNKPNFRKPKMNITSILTKTYKNIFPLCLRQNKPNQSQFQSILFKIFLAEFEIAWFYLLQCQV
jgi:hypothetical protein